MARRKQPDATRLENITMSTTELVPLDQVEDVLINGGTLDVVNPDAVQDDIVQRILGASDLSEAFAEYKATPAADVDGILLDVTGIAWMKSSFKDGPAVYALFQCQLVESGDEVTVSMGGRSLMASFLWAQRNKAMPIRGTFRAQQSRANPDQSFWTFILADLEK